MNCKICKKRIDKIGRIEYCFDNKSVYQKTYYYCLDCVKIIGFSIKNKVQQEVTDAKNTGVYRFADF